MGKEENKKQLIKSVEEDLNQLDLIVTFLEKKVEELEQSKERKLKLLEELENN